MPLLTDIPLIRFEDGTVVVNVTPPTDIGGWSIQFQVQKKWGPGSSGLITKSIASGFANGVSGITITNSGQGIFQVAIASQDTSGLQQGNYDYRCERLDSGSKTILALGSLVLF